MADDIPRHPGSEPYDVDDPNQKGMSEEQKFLETMRNRLRVAWNYWNETFETGQDDVKCIYIDQWPADVRAIRGERPTNSMNMLPQYINKVVAFLRRSKVDIQYASVGGITADDFTDETPPYAETLEGIVRQISYQNNLPHKLARAGQHAVEAGLGWNQIRVGPDPNDAFRDAIFVDHIKDRWSVLPDAFAAEADFSDMGHCFVSVFMPKDEFQALHPDAKVPGFGGNATDGTVGTRALSDFEQWVVGKDGVRVFDYWYREKVRKEFVELVNEERGLVIVNHREFLEDFIEPLKQYGFVEKRSRQVDVWEVKWCRCTAEEILDEPEDWPGSMIPLIPVVGRQIDRIDSSLYVGVVHYGIEPQRVFNLWVSHATEKTASQTKNPYIATADQIAEHKHDWENASTGNPFFLTYDPDGEAPPPQRSPHTDFPIAEIQMAEIFRRQIQESIGIYDAVLGKKSNETSGVAIQSRQEASSESVLEFVDNVGISATCMGRHFAELVPRVYKGRIMATLDAEDREGAADLTGLREASGGMRIVNALQLGSYSVRAAVGPATITQRQEFARELAELAKANPRIMEIAGDLFMSALDMPFARQIAKRFRMMLPPMFLSEEERQALPPREPTPDEVIAGKELEVKNLELERQGREHKHAIRMKEMDISTGRQRLEMSRLNTQKAEAEAATGEGEDSIPIPEIKKIVREEIAEHERGRAH